MTLVELLLLAVSLCFDTFAVSIGGGVSLRDIKFSKKAVIMAFFAFFQAGLLWLGWLSGALFADYIMEWDHWIAFIILLYVGGKMILENVSAGLKSDEESSPKECSCKNRVDLRNYKTLTVLSIATSIDAIAVGVSLALVSISTLRVAFIVVMTFIFTALASYIGLVGGGKIGCKIGAKASILGGVVLVLIGIKIVVEHIFF